MIYFKFGSVKKCNEFWLIGFVIGWNDVIVVVDVGDSIDWVVFSIGVVG